MQAAALGAMPAYTILTASSPSYTLLSPLLNANLTQNPPFLHSSFHGISLKLPRQPFSLSLSPTSPKKNLTVVATTKKAAAVLNGTSNVEGVVTLAQEADGPTTMNACVTCLTPGPHGLHLHEYGDTTNGCISTGAHFNLNNRTHGALEDETRHAGNLGNIVANADGVAEATIVDNQIPLSGANTVIGGAFVVHELEDDLGRVGAVPKKRTSLSKKRIRKNIWKRKGYVAALKAFSLAKSLYTGKSKSFWANAGKKD